MSFTVYILYSNPKNRYFIGQTQDLTNRLAEHNHGESRSTKSGIPWTLVYQREFDTRSEAMVYENHLKKMKSRKFIETLLKSG
ncbi:MAG: GIY-YIG nuclease family protein [Candidatus Neomarinimicrobiota bacterium]